MRDWIALARPRQWSKNLLLYAAFLFTAGDEWTFEEPRVWLPMFLSATVAFLAFCLMSSAGYLLNDVRDAALDRAHPRKRDRPIASGRLEPVRVRHVAVILALAAFFVGGALGVWFLLALASYLTATIAYTFALKRIALLDVLTVAGLFALRALAGALAIDVEASPWIIVCTFAGALFVAAVKREQERWLLGDAAGAHRETLEGGAGWPRWVAGIAAVATAGLYLAYAATAPNLPASGSMLATVPLVVAALWRYRTVARARPDRDAEEVAFRDPVVLMLVVGFVALAVALLLKG